MIWLTLGTLAPIIRLSDATSNPAPKAQQPLSASTELEFQAIDDGHCQNLSEGGKLQVMKNKHPSKPVKYRLVRYFAGTPQPGLIPGVAEPSGEEVKLGCTRVDGREQRWEIQRAVFVN
jgi:hypothetical protein